MFALLINAGSSSLKASLVAVSDGHVIAEGGADWAGAETHYRYRGPDGQEVRQKQDWKGPAPAVQHFIQDILHREPIALTSLGNLLAVAHRVVHGGSAVSALKITSAVRAHLQELSVLAPLHNPPSLEAIAAAEQAFPTVPHFAVFDTAFHTTLPPEAFTFPLPEAWTDLWGIRRYGFHGLSHAYCSQRAAELVNRPVEELRTIVCHLGHGCSMSAIRAGKSVDTSMGFTPTDGLMMATRCGAIDPAIIPYVQQRYQLSPAEVEQVLNRQSGLLGVSVVSSDLREVSAAAQAGHVRSQLALSMYVFRIRKTIGAYAAVLGGLEVLVFTAGVGEHSAEIRASVCQNLDFLGIRLDSQLNRDCRPDAEISASAASVRTLVIRCREDLQMLREIQPLQGSNRSGPQ